MAIIEVYVGVTAQLIKVKCRTKDKRDIVARAARKVARSLGGSGGTPLLLRKMTGESDSPVATLRMSKAAVEEMVLVAEDENGTKRLLSADELPVELLMNSKGAIRRLLLISPAMMSHVGETIAAPPAGGGTNVVMDGSDDEDDQSSGSRTGSRTSFRPSTPAGTFGRSGGNAAAARNLSMSSEASLGRTSSPQMYPSIDGSGKSSPRRTSSMMPRVSGVAGAADARSPPAFAATLFDSPAVGHAIAAATMPATATQPPPDLLPAGVRLVKLNAALMGPPPDANMSALFGPANAWLFAVPDAYAFRLEWEALDLVSASQAVDLQHSYLVDNVLQRAAEAPAGKSARAVTPPPQVNRGSKPTAGATKVAVKAKAPTVKVPATTNKWMF